MAGPPHTFQTGFPNAQQAAMRNQFVAAGGLMTPNQGGLMAPNQTGLMTPNQQSGVYEFHYNFMHPNPIGHFLIISKLIILLNFAMHTEQFMTIVFSLLYLAIHLSYFIKWK